MNQFKLFLREDSDQSFVASGARTSNAAGAGSGIGSGPLYSRMQKNDGNAPILHVHKTVLDVSLIQYRFRIQQNRRALRHVVSITA